MHGDLPDVVLVHSILVLVLVRKAHGATDTVAVDLLPRQSINDKAAEVIFRRVVSRSLWIACECGS